MRSTTRDGGKMTDSAIRIPWVCGLTREQAKGVATDNWARREGNLHNHQPA